MNASLHTSNDIAQTYLNTLVAHHPDTPIANEALLFSAQLNFSIGSLQRVESLLETLQDRNQHDFSNYLDEPAKNNCLLVLAFYIGELAAKYKKTHVHWFTPKQFATVFPNDLPLSDSPHDRYVAVINNQLFKPIAFVLRTILHKQSIQLTQFLQDNLNSKNPVQLSPISTATWLSHAIGDVPTQNEQQPHTSHHSAPANHTDNANQTASSVSDMSINAPDDEQTTENHVNEQTKSQNDVNQQAAPTSQKVTEANTHNTITPTAVPTSMIPEEMDSPIDSKAPAMVRTTSTPSKLIQSFKPVILPYLLFSLPCAVLGGYAIYQVVASILAKHSVSTSHVIMAAVFSLLLIAIWVVYWLSNINVFDNKVGFNSPIKNTAAIFDHDTRFFHVSPAQPNPLSDFFGIGTYSKILTATDTLSIAAQKHDGLEDLLLELETSLLLQPTLDKLAQNETVIFGEMQLTKDLLVYGKKGIAINRVGDYDITEGDLIIQDTTGQPFARIALATQPNINTLISAIEHLQTLQ